MKVKTEVVELEFQFNTAMQEDSDLTKRRLLTEQVLLKKNWGLTEQLLTYQGQREQQENKRRRVTGNPYAQHCKRPQAGRGLSDWEQIPLSLGTQKKPRLTRATST